MTFVRTHTGEKILCCWDECDRFGQLEYGWQWPEDRHSKGPIRLFCSDRHRELYINSPRHHKLLPVGSKSLLAPR